MKRFMFTLITAFILNIGVNAQNTHTVNISGFTFSPSDLSISVGDKVVFDGSSNHPIAEVSLGAWNTNSNTPLSGGFTFSSGVGEKIFNTAGTFYYICQNHISSGMKGKITVSTTTNTSNILNPKDISIYPNPLSEDYLNISFNEQNLSNIEISIFDITGKSKKVLLEKLINNKIRINCSDLYSGIYILQVNINNKISTTKLVRK